MEDEFSTARGIVIVAPQGSALVPVLYSPDINYAPRHLELILFCSRTISLFTRQRNTNVATRPH
jgi:hypothetical protein